MSNATAVEIPPLQDGDLLDQPEFHRRYCAMPEDFRAELIEGRVYVMSPAYGRHSTIQTILAGWIGDYVDETPGVAGGMNHATLLNLQNQVEPDGIIYVLASHGGQSTLDQNRCVVGAPEFVIEVSDMTEAKDSKMKLRAYEEAGVQEYLNVLACSGVIRWHVRKDGKFRELKSETGIVKSQVLPGLWLDGRALLEEKRRPVLACLQLGLASPEHAAFVMHLASRLASKD